MEQTAGLASPPPGTRAALRGPVAAALERGGGPFVEWPGRRESKAGVAKDAEQPAVLGGAGGGMEAHER